MNEYRKYLIQAESQNPTGLVRLRAWYMIGWISQQEYLDMRASMINYAPVLFGSVRSKKFSFIGDAK